MNLAYRIVNVFAIAGQRLSGNPLCVFEDGRGLSDGQMQALARQLNLSETTFVLPATADGATAHVRIFTPTLEMPFAGHPTLGTAHVVAAGRDKVVLEMRAGLVPVTGRASAWTLRAKPPTTRPLDASRADVAAMLGLPVEALAGEPLWVNTGTEQLIIPLRHPDDVRTARPDQALLNRHAMSPDRGEAMAYVAAGDQVRFFFTAHGAIVEDPATGSACANLGGYLLATGAALPIERTLHQGDAVGRPSRLHLRVDPADRAIYVTGEVIELGRGSFEL
jgi:trans-2,3-dihydro-3-hydroxyanthranilate isomerase